MQASAGNTIGIKHIVIVGHIFLTFPVHELILYVTLSDKIGHIAEKYMCSVYQLNCGCYLNIVCFVQLLRIFCI